MNHQRQFQSLIEAIESLKIFPETIEEFTKLLKQRYQRKHSSSRDLEWISRLCGVYYDNCYNYMIFVKRVFAAQFLAKCLTADQDVACAQSNQDAERKEIITELKANIGAAMKPAGRLDRFTSDKSKEEVLKNIDKVLAQMEHLEKKEAEKQKYFQKFSTWLKDMVLDQVSVVFAKFIGPLWDMVIENAVLAVQSDYDHESFKLAIECIKKNLPCIEDSIKKNRRALEAITAVLDVLERDNEENLKTGMQWLYPMESEVKNACDDISTLLEKLKDS